jgi:homopolymeric O-antigen transport system permease protein
LSAATPVAPVGAPNAGQSVYDSAERRSRTIDEARALWRYRGLVHELIVRDIKVRYKRSVLGIVWTMLAPLLNMVALTLVFSTLLKQQITNYPVFFMAGAIFWAFFSQSTSSAAAQTQDSNEIAKRIYIPRSVFVAAAIGVGLVNLALSLVPLLLILIVTGFPIYTTWAFLPVAVFIEVLFAAGVSLWLFTFASRFSDIREMYQVIVQTWFFLTPIVYHPAIVPPKYRFALWLNPLYYLIQIFRKPIYDGVLPSPALVGASFAISLVVFVSGWIYFSNRAERFAFLS